MGVRVHGRLDCVGGRVRRWAYLVSLGVLLAVVSAGAWAAEARVSSSHGGPYGALEVSEMISDWQTGCERVAETEYNSADPQVDWPYSSEYSSDPAAWKCRVGNADGTNWRYRYPDVEWVCADGNGGVQIVGEHDGGTPPTCSNEWPSEYDDLPNQVEGKGPSSGVACHQGYEYILGDPGSPYVTVGSDSAYGTWNKRNVECTSTTDNAINSDSSTLTDSDGNQYVVDESNVNCGTFNGERVCMDKVPPAGECVVDSTSGEYTCASASTSPVAPSHDPETESVNETAGPMTVELELPDGSTQDRVTLSGGTVESGGGSLDDGTGDAEAGSELAGDETQEEETPGFCEENPKMCDTEYNIDDPGSVPESSVDISNLSSGYSGPIADTGTCPQAETISFMGTSFDIPYTAFCDYAQTIRPILIAAAALGSLFFAVRALA